MNLILHVVLLSLGMPSADGYSKVGELKEPDWADSVAVAEPSDYFKVGELEEPDWSQSVAIPEDATGDADGLYAKLEDLKDPY